MKSQVMQSPVACNDQYPTLLYLAYMAWQCERPQFSVIYLETSSLDGEVNSLVISCNDVKAVHISNE